MHISLYRKYRPQRFSDVAGQVSAVNMLRSSFLEKRLGHAYLFSGPRGCGKTTAARLLAKLVNCANPSSDGEPCCECLSCRAVVAGDHLDVMEIDGASNRGIDQIRELKSHVGLASFQGGIKVYILDEVHMLTAEAFNALLKTLEEPPASVLFIFATTEPHKVPVTIRSRCQHIPFHRISTEDMVARLRHIAASEQFETEDAALWEIARSADGALRDAISLSEQALALGSGRLSSEAVRSLFGGGSRRELERWLSLLRTDPAEASAMLKEMLDKGVSPERFLDVLFPLIRDLWVFCLWGEKSFAGVSLSEEEKRFLKDEAPHWRSDQLRRAARTCSSLFPRARWGLSAEIFSGMLLFEFLGLFDGQSGQSASEIAPPVSPNDRNASSVQKEYGAPALPLRDDKKRNAKPLASSPSSRNRSEPAVSRNEDCGGVPEPAATGDVIVPEGLPEALTALWANDLPLCAAMIDVGISVAEGQLMFDYSEASLLARATLETPRAQQAMARAFGLIPGVMPRVPESGHPEEASAATGGRNGPVNAGTMSIEALSAYLGADLLVSKRIAVADDISEPLAMEDVPEHADN